MLPGNWRCSMSLSFISILLFIVGIIAGFVAMFVINNIKNSSKEKQATKGKKTIRNVHKKKSK